MQLLAAIFAGVALTQGSGIESWADARLPVRDGLALWLDATRQGKAYAAAAREAPIDGSALGVGYDASGKRRDLVQRVRAMQPRLIGEGDGAVVRFDGVDDALAATGLAATLGDFTLFVRAVPRSNGGGFRGLVAANATGRNDYRSGFNLDLSFAPTSRLEVVNVEGSGFGGAVDLLASAYEFGTFHTFAVSASRGSAGVALFVDGRLEGRRDREDTPLRLDELTVGARFYSNDSDVPTTTGFSDGDVEEVLLYERPLSDEERTRVELYLSAKYAPAERALTNAARLHRVELEHVAPSPVQLFVPGFTVRELPVELHNINNVAFREDGMLVALGYDGNVHLLNDRDGDGVPESVRRFFANEGAPDSPGAPPIEAPIGMALTPKGYSRGRGLFIACKGRVVLLADTNGDDVADRIEVVATGWPTIRHNVDALGVALAPDGRLFFGLGAADYTNAYLVDAAGSSHYERKSERGTILEVSPDLRSRRIYCTGIRFPVGMRFNRAGDLFATDQEGATWLANGNPFDELLHIEEGRHYGFPPRHPGRLPGVIDEPSLFDYGPQHQSTCGFCFNEPAVGHPQFGPASWEGDALVTGYSRGKLFRTQLERTAAGYVARNQLLASFAMLVCDAALGPHGELVVACHSGAPDWGSGPSGRGKLYQLQYRGFPPSGPPIPQPIATFAAGPQEVRVAFDRPLDPKDFERIVARTHVTFGKAVGAGDRFEFLRPGYETVERQQRAPRYDLPVLSLQLTQDRRTISLITAPHALLLPHALDLPPYDLAYDLGGVEYEWRADDGSDSASGWLPHLDLALAHRFTEGSSEHERLWRELARPGRLTLRSALDLSDLLRPLLQPGTRINYAWPDEEAALVLRSNAKLSVALFEPVDGAEVRTLATERAVEVRWKPAPGRLLPVEVTLTTGATGPVPAALDVEFHTKEDARPRALPLRRFVSPWAAHLGDADADGRAVDEAGAPRPELAGGNWSRGRAVFFGETAMCSKCHTLDDGTGRGARGRIGPDLTHLWQRDSRSVRNDILDPSGAINPDYVAFHLKLADGRELDGVPRSEGEAAIVVGEAGGKETSVRAGEIVSRESLSTSIMPVGLHNVLTPKQVTDLLTYVLARPLEPSPIEIEGAPPPRKLSEVEAVLKRSSKGDANAPPPPLRVNDPPPLRVNDPPPLRVVVVAGPKDHGVNEHDYPDWQRRWEPLLARADGVSVETAQEWPSESQLAAADVVVMFSANPAWSSVRARELDAFLARGGGLLLLHYAVNGHDAVPELAARVGLAWRDGASRFRHGAVDLEFTSRASPIASGFERLHLVDETYWELVGDESSVTVLATSNEEGRARPQIWTRDVGRGRVFCSLLGHYRWTFDDPLYRLLLLRAIAWAGHQPEERLADLATAGARVERD